MADCIHIEQVRLAKQQSAIADFLAKLHPRKYVSPRFAMRDAADLIAACNRAAKEPSA